MIEQLEQRQLMAVAIVQRPMFPQPDEPGNVVVAAGPVRVVKTEWDQTDHLGDAPR